MNEKSSLVVKKAHDEITTIKFRFEDLTHPPNNKTIATSTPTPTPSAISRNKIVSRSTSAPLQRNRKSDNLFQQYAIPNDTNSSQISDISEINSVDSNIVDPKFQEMGSNMNVMKNETKLRISEYEVQIEYCSKEKFVEYCETLHSVCFGLLVPELEQVKWKYLLKMNFVI